MKISVLSLVPNNNICCILVIYMQDSGLLLLTHRSHQFHFEVWAFLICLNRQESIRLCSNPMLNLNGPLVNLCAKDQINGDLQQKVHDDVHSVSLFLKHHLCLNMHLYRVLPSLYSKQLRLHLHDYYQRLVQL